MVRSFFYPKVSNIPPLAIISLTIALCATPGHAVSPKKVSPGFSGWVDAGIAYVTSTDQLDTDADKRANGLGSNADRYHDALPLLLFDLRYTFSPSGRQIYFGTPREQEGPPILNLGAALPFEDGSELDVSVFGKPFEEVWKDPYLSGVRRDDTNKQTFGAKLAYSDILATPIGISYSLAHADVDDDDIGERFDSLARDGWLHQAQVEYAFSLGRGVSIVPGFKFSVADLDGNANSYKGYNLRVGLRSFTPSYRMNLTAAVGLNDYDRTHPIFDKTRDDWLYSLFGMFSISELLGHKSLSSTLIAGYRHRDSNIGFLKADTFLGGLTVGYKF